MVNSHLNVLEFAARHEIHETLENLSADFANLVAEFGFTSFILTGLPKHGIDVEPLVVCNRWPVSWSDRYREQNYFPDDPVSRWSLGRRKPFLWREARRFDGTTYRTRQIAGEGWDHGLADGIAFPLRDRPGGAVVSLAADHVFNIDPRVQASLFLAASYYKMAAERFVRKQAETPILTRRELEVLHWKAAGKTAWEISCILSLSHSTIKTHLSSIRQKLGVATTTQAIASELLTGNILP
ncbi:MAG TPA: LuxR family transcriptional regulator [Rhizobiaceae bacterium]|nr:LuxR family transcriptional regulator [Rhizobiaceae bacterium]